MCVEELDHEEKKHTACSSHFPKIFPRLELVLMMWKEERLEAVAETGFPYLVQIREKKGCATLMHFPSF